MNYIILGAGGFAREVAWNILNLDTTADFLFVDDITEIISVQIYRNEYKVIKDWRFPENFNYFTIGVGSPKAKRIMVEKALANGIMPRNTIIHPRAMIQDAEIGVGGVITSGVAITTNVKIGNYVVLNLNTTIGHDSIIEDYVTCNPSCSISGNVTLREGCFIGVGATILEKKIVGSYASVGAQACVVKDVLDNIIVVGIPAKELKK